MLRELLQQTKGLFEGSPIIDEAIDLVQRWLLKAGFSYIGFRINISSDKACSVFKILQQLGEYKNKKLYLLQ